MHGVGNLTNFLFESVPFLLLMMSTLCVRNRQVTILHQDSP